LISNLGDEMSSSRIMLKLERHFEAWHKNPPAGFNPDYKPHARAMYAKTSSSMVDDGFYDNHTREECKVEWGKRYDVNMKEYEARL